MRNVVAWLPVVLLPAGVLLLTPERWPRWAFMWLLAFAIYAGCKWLTWVTATARGAPWWRHAGYLALWPGLDADAFLHRPVTRRPATSEWIFGSAKLLLGILLLWGIAPLAQDELARGWLGMLGIVFALHFGLFDLFRLIWQTVGVDARPLMDWPIAARSVSEFWGRRWNTAFRDLTHRFLFRPLTALRGASAALTLGFLFSGVVHDLVISLPANAGYGGPTLYFALQGAAIFLERSTLGVWIGLGSGWVGWTFTMVCLAAPLPLLFHAPFVRGVVVPFVDCLDAPTMGGFHE